MEPPLEQGGKIALGETPALLLVEVEALEGGFFLLPPCSLSSRLLVEPEQEFLDAGAAHATSSVTAMPVTQASTG